jgi:hypothetical protein
MDSDEVTVKLAVTKLCALTMAPGPKRGARSLCSRRGQVHGEVDVMRRVAVDCRLGSGVTLGITFTDGWIVAHQSATGE